jgi:hypothetical protein
MHDTMEKPRHKMPSAAAMSELKVAERPLLLRFRPIVAADQDRLWHGIHVALRDPAPAQSKVVSVRTMNHPPRLPSLGDCFQEQRTTCPASRFGMRPVARPKSVTFGNSHSSRHDVSQLGYPSDRLG